MDARTISGDEEARLTFLGATAGRDAGADAARDRHRRGQHRVRRRPPGEDPGFHVSTRMGSVRHTERHCTATRRPRPSCDALAEDARAIVEAEVPAEVREHVDAGIAVAGTATSLAAIDQELDPYDPERVQGYLLSRRAASAGRAAGGLTVAERRELAGLHPDRAPTIVAGAVILLESMRGLRPGPGRGHARTTSSTAPRWPPRIDEGAGIMPALPKTAPSGRAGVRAMKGPCGSDGGRRRYDAASPEPMYRVKADGSAARQATPSAANYNRRWDRLKRVHRSPCVYRRWRAQARLALRG